MLKIFKNPWLKKLNHVIDDTNKLVQLLSLEKNSKFLNIKKK